MRNSDLHEHSGVRREEAGHVSRLFATAIGVLKRPPIATALAIVATSYLLLLLNSLRPRWRLLDFSNFYVAASAFLDGVNPYTADLGQLAARLNMDLGAEKFVNLDYPPSFILIFLTLARLYPLVAYGIWTGLNFLTLAALLFLLIWRDPRFGGSLRVSLISLSVLFFPIEENLHFGQIQVLILILLLIAYRSARGGRDLMAGGAIAVASLLKVYPLIALGYFILWRRWRVVAYAAIGLVAGTLITVGMIGSEVSYGFLSRIQSLTAVAGPLSINRLVVRGFGVRGQGPFYVLTRLEKDIAIAAKLAILGVTMAVTLNARPDRAGEERTFGLWLMAPVMLTSGWANYLVFFLPTLVILGAAADEGSASAASLWCGAATYLWTTAIGFAILVPPLRDTLGYTLGQTYGAFLPCGLLGFLTACLAAGRLRE